MLSNWPILLLGIHLAQLNCVASYVESVTYGIYFLSLVQCCPEQSCMMGSCDWVYLSGFSGCMGYWYQGLGLLGGGWS